MGEFENSRKNHARAMDSLQASLEAESRAKAEALRIKKKLESDINELEIALDHANKANAEAHKSVKRYQGQLRDVEGSYEEEKRGRIEIAERAGLADRKANALQGELEESRSLLDSADRGKKQTEMELAEARAAVNDMTAINSKAASEKRALESQVVELENRLAEANEMAVKGGRNAMAKMEGRIREMEMELGGVQSKTSETYKSYQKSERRIKELNFQRDEDKKNSDRITELAQKLQQKIKVYKKQIEEAEEIAALNLAKYRKAQQELEETEDRSRMAEGALSVARQSTGFM